MSKEWICADCVKFKTDACSTCACGYVPIVSCRDVLVDFDYAYEKGRADAIAELKEKYLDADSYNEGIADGRADAIDEFKKLIHKNINELNHHQVDFLAEQMKGA